jgi:hypothetical protein
VPSKEEIERITRLRDEGRSLEEIGEELKKDKSTISRWFKGLGIDCNEVLQRCTTKRATEAKVNYDLARRMELNNKFFKRLEEFTDEKITARDFKDLMISYGILEDKRALLEPPKPTGEGDILDRIIGSLENHATISIQTGRSVPGLSQDPPNPDVRVGEKRKD